MFDTSDIFSSRSRFKVLRTIFQQTKPLSLRRIAHVSEEALFSVQRTLDQLVKEKFLIKTRKAPYTFFSINKDHEAYDFLEALFELETKTKIKVSADKFHQKAKALLTFSTSTRDLLQKARS